jgi:hypothetical protein
MRHSKSFGAEKMLAKKKLVNIIRYKHRNSGRGRDSDYNYLASTIINENLSTKYNPILNSLPVFICSIFTNSMD